MVAIGKTADLEWIVTADGGSDMAVLANVLGGGVAGSGTVTNESFLREQWEQASIHSVGSAVSFTSIYDTPAFDTAISSLLGSGSVSVGAWLFVAGLKTPKSWEGIPADFVRPGKDASSVNAITRPWAATQRDRKYIGHGAKSVQTVTIDSDGSASGLLVAGDDRAALGFTHAFVYVKALASGLASLHLDDGNTAANLAERAGLQGPFALSATNQALTIDCDTADQEVTVLLGKLEDLPDG